MGTATAGNLVASGGPRYCGQRSSLGTVWSRPAPTPPFMRRAPPQRSDLGLGCAACRDGDSRHCTPSLTPRACPVDRGPDRLLPVQGVGQRPRVRRCDRSGPCPGQPVPGTVGTVTDTLGHVTRVEGAWPPWQRQGMGREDAAIRVCPGSGSAALSWTGLRPGSEAANRASPEANLRVPWFDFPITVREEGLQQAPAHSHQHRGQVLSWLGTRGVEAPDSITR